MGELLNLEGQYRVSQEPQREFPLGVLEGVKLNSVFDLTLWYVDVNRAEILREAVANEDAA